ncbi:hypothetical protein [Xanthocytophaga agilis]|uniref:DUF4348 domain-containing protein n=1 Tax=Xanthocytophaga agilis TaxID=3048010 RepID=A0AAE3R3L1_9BACT|nr:hypothetical protein [Xanthocytophaga agilis]MDJ1500785.1 hypothetical protein [Xanthocytophaga agilis]
MRFSLYCSFLLFSAIFNDKRNQEKTIESMIDVTHIEQENFKDFYIRFHQDSSFQKERLLFPLQGHKISENRAGQIVKEKWTVSNWVILKVPIDRIDTLPKFMIVNNDTIKITHYKTTRLQSQDVITEKIWLVDSSFYFEIRFKLVKGKWYLFYCEEADM